MQIFKQSGIKLFNDLVTVNDRREFGWTLLFTDVVALVEQRVIGSGAGYFYAHGMSSVCTPVYTALSVLTATGRITGRWGHPEYSSYLGMGFPNGFT